MDHQGGDIRMNRIDTSTRMAEESGDPRSQSQDGESARFSANVTGNSSCCRIYPRQDQANDYDYNNKPTNDTDLTTTINELGENLNTFSVSDSSQQPRADPNDSRRTFAGKPDDITDQQQTIISNLNCVEPMDSSDDQLSPLIDQQQQYQLMQRQGDGAMAPEDNQQNIYPAQQQFNSSDILIVTNLDPSVFHDEVTKAKFESLFLVYDGDVKFRYLRSFRRVRLDFSSRKAAELARFNLNHYQFGNTEFKCYPVQMIRAGSSNNSGDIESTRNSMHLSIPKLTKQFLISPPASPPVGWEPVIESSPVIDVQLISAIANLVPGKTHEIHAGNDSQPGIFVEVCEESPFGDAIGRRTCSRIIPKTASPVINHQPNLTINHY